MLLVLRPQVLLQLDHIEKLLLAILTALPGPFLGLQNFAAMLAAPSVRHRLVLAPKFHLAQRADVDADVVRLHLMPLRGNVGLEHLTAMFAGVPE